MPDITMCQGSSLIANGRLKVDEAPKITECPKKETCYRFKAKPSEFRQAYFMGIPYDPGTDSCSWFLPLHKREAVEALDGPVASDVARFLKGLP